MQPRIPVRKSKQEISLYLENGKIFGDILFQLYNMVSSGELLTGLEIEQEFYSLVNKVDSNLWKMASYPFELQKNYLSNVFSNKICVSTNDEIAHCRPTNKKFKNGDVISVDVGLLIPIPDTNKNLYYDSAFTAMWKNTIPDNWILASYNALLNIKNKQPMTTHKTSEIIYRTAIDNSLQTVVMLTGHGIGYSLHEEPYIRNAPGNFSNTDFFEGLCFCAEPIFVLPGKQEKNFLARAYVDSDGWSVRTINSQPSSHFETMFCILNGNLIDICNITDWFC